MLFSRKKNSADIDLVCSDTNGDVSVPWSPVDGDADQSVQKVESQVVPGTPATQADEVADSDALT